MYGYCNIEWVIDDNLWIVCDVCDMPYHLQCSGISCDKNFYYKIDVENMDYLCDIYEV